MKIKTFNEFINESKAYDLGLKSSSYEKSLKKILKSIPEISEYLMNTSNKIYLHSINGMHGTDLTDKIKELLKDFDPNLDLDNIKNDLNAKSKHNKDNGITRYEISKKIDFRQDRNGDYSKPDVVKMSHDIVLDIMDMMAQYTSTATHLADVEWNSLKSFMDSAKDEVNAEDFKKIEKAVKEKYPNLK